MGNVGMGVGGMWALEDGGHRDREMETVGMGTWQQGGRGYLGTLGQGGIWVTWEYGDRRI